MSADFFIGAGALAALAFLGTPASSTPVIRDLEPAAASDDDVVTGYINGQAVELQLRDIGNGFKLRVDAALAFLQMRAAALLDGVQLLVDSAFRTMAEQQHLFELYQEGLGNLAAQPGYSNHQGGVALDIATAAGSNDAFRWLNSYAAHFGFKRTVPSEPWHWEYS